jgi:hypothetical protein
MIQINIQNASETKVCGVHEIELLSQLGWRLCAMFDSKSWQPASMQWNNSLNRNEVIEPGHEVATPMAVMALVHDDPVAELQAELSVHRTDTEKARSEARTATDALKKAKSDAEMTETSLNERLKIAQADSARAYEREKTANTRAQKLEADLGKVRVALGELKMKEIVGT